MLKYRLLMSAVLLPAFAAIFYFDGRTGPLAALFGPACMVLAGLAAGELVTMVRNRVPTVTRLDVILASVSLVFVAWAVHAGPALTWVGAEKSEQLAAYDSARGRLDTYGVRGLDGTGPITNLLAYSQVRTSLRDQGLYDAPATVLAAGVCAAVVICWLAVWLLEAAVRYEKGRLKPGDVIAHVSAKLLILGYAGGLIAATSQLRWYGTHAWAGYRLLAGLLIAVKAGDVGAYFIGRALGRRHPLKRLSPGKTEAGFIGAVVVGGAAFALWMTFAPYRMSAKVDSETLVWLLLKYFWLGGILAIGGVVGDLIESLFKRECGVKDSSTMLPGFGGVLDVLDSVLFVGASLVAATTLAATFATIIRI